MFSNHVAVARRRNFWRKTYNAGMCVNAVGVNDMGVRVVDRHCVGLHGVDMLGVGMYETCMPCLQWLKKNIWCPFKNRSLILYIVESF